MNSMIGFDGLYVTGFTPSSTPPCAATFVELEEVDDTVALMVFATVCAIDEDAMMAAELRSLQRQGEQKKRTLMLFYLPTLTIVTAANILHVT